MKDIFKCQRKGFFKKKITFFYQSADKTVSDAFSFDVGGCFKPDAPVSIKKNQSENAIHIHVNGEFRRTVVFSDDVSSKKGFDIASRALHSPWGRRIKIGLFALLGLIVIDEVTSLGSSQSSIAYSQDGAAHLAQQPSADHQNHAAAAPYAFNPNIKMPEVEMPQLSCAEDAGAK